MPDLCLECGGHANSAEDRPPNGLLAQVRGARFGLCAKCRELLRPPPTDHCATCGRTLSSRRRTSKRPQCDPCSGKRLLPTRLFWLWEYATPLNSVVAAYKFGGLDYLARDFAEETVGRHGLELRQFDLLTSVPLHWRRRLDRGFDQAALLGKLLARETGVPYLRLLARTRHGRPQSGLPRHDRLRNASLSFRPTGCSRWSHRAGRLRGEERAARSLLLVDDVTTTGATLRACTRSLHRAGWRNISWLVIGRTP